jgi:hypothetical protein
LKEFGLNLKGKDCLKKSLKKRKEKEKKKAYLLTFSARRPSGPSIPSRSGPSSSSFSFFPADADIWAPPVSLSPPLSFLLPLPAAQPTRRRRNPRRARPPLHLPFLSARPIKAINLP